MNTLENRGTYKLGQGVRCNAKGFCVLLTFRLKVVRIADATK